MPTTKDRSVRPIPARDLRAIFHPRTPANDIFEPEYEPTPWDNDGVTSALERDLRGYELIAIILGGFVLLLGITAVVAL